MTLPHHLTWPALTLLIGGIACSTLATAQTGPYGPGGRMGPGMEPGRMPMGPGTMPMGPGAPGMGPGMGPGRGMHMPSFSAFDADDDGRISQAELNTARAERQRQRAAQGYPMRGAANAPDFSAIDADGSGGISPEEFARFHGGARRP